MELHGEPPIRFLDVGVSCVATDAEHLIKIAFRHSFPWI
jgi:hypothetical protein